MRILLVINEHSRRGDSDIGEAIDVFEAAGHSVAMVRVARSRFADAVIRARAGEFDAIVLGGGDGTPHSAAPALLDAGLPVGLLPLGTCNDLAHSLGIPADIAAAAAVVVGGRTAAIDVGEVNGVPFFNVAHIGLGATLRVRKKMKRRFGPLAYAIAAATSLRGFRPFRATIAGESSQERVAVFNVTIGNGRYFGGSGMVSETARIDDGLLHLFTLRTKAPLHLLALIPFFLRGRQDRSRVVDTRSSERFEITTSRPVPIRADGKAVGDTPASINVRRGALHFFVDGEAFSRPDEKRAFL